MRRSTPSWRSAPAPPASRRVAAVKDAGKAGVRVASFDLSANFLKSIAAGEAAFAIDQQQYLQGYLPVVFLALNAKYGLDPRRQRAVRPEPDHQGEGRAGRRPVRQGHSLGIAKPTQPA